MSKYEVDLLLVLTGLDGVILPYIPMFLSNEVKGQQLLNLRSDDLENIGVYTIGHQELILEAVGQLRNFVSIFEHVIFLLYKSRLLNVNLTVLNFSTMS